MTIAQASETFPHGVFSRGQRGFVSSVRYSFSTGRHWVGAFGCAVEKDP